MDAKLRQEILDKYREQMKNNVNSTEFWDDMKSNIRTELKTTNNKETLRKYQQEIDVLYVHRLENAKFLSRGTQTVELDTMLEGMTVGYKSYNPNYTYFSTSNETAESYAFGETDYQPHEYHNNDYKDPGNSSIPVIISIPKNKIENDIVSPGYTIDYGERAQESDIYEPQGYNFLNEEEHRLVPGKISVKGLGLKITIFTKDSDKRRKFLKKYKILGDVNFA